MSEKIHRFGEKPNTFLIIGLIIIISLALGIGLSLFFSREVTKIVWDLKAEPLLNLVATQTSRQIEPADLADWISETAKTHFNNLVAELQAALPPIAAVKIFNQNSILIAATIDRDSIGREQADETPKVAAALGGAQTITLAEKEDEEKLHSNYLLDIYTPFTFSTGEKVVINVYFDASNYADRILRFQILVWLLVLTSLALTGGTIYLGARAQNRRILRQALELFSIIDHSPIGIFTVNAAGIIDSANPKISELAEGIGKKEFVGKKTSEVMPYREAGIDKFLFNCLGGKACETQARFSINGDKNLYQHYYCVPIFSTDGKKVEHLLILVSDITDRMTAEEEKKSLNELKNKFVTIVSHQLRTPLGVTRWNLESVLEGGDGKKIPHEETLRVAHGATVEVINRINDLLTALDISEDKIRLNQETVQLEDLAKAIFEEFKPAINLKKIKFNPSWPETPLSAVEADQAKMREVFRKLFDNAIVYNREDGEITLSFTPKKGKIIFEIFDKGIGIPKSEQKHVFERFFRASNAFTAKPDASGLGLYIAKNIVEAHGGTLGFKSTEGRGSVFWFELPLV